MPTPTPARLAAKSRRDQGLPATVEDPAVLARVAALLTALPRERRSRRAYADNASDEDRARWTAAVDRATRSAS